MTSFNEHPSDDQLLAYLDGDSTGREEIGCHIASCKECEDFVFSLGQAELYATIAPECDDPAREQRQLAIVKRVIAEQAEVDRNVSKIEQVAKEENGGTDPIELRFGKTTYESMLNNAPKTERATTANRLWTHTKTTLLVAVAASVLLVFYLNWSISPPPIVRLNIELKESELLDDGSSVKMRPTLSIVLDKPPSGKATVAVASKNSKDITYYDDVFEIPGGQRTWVYPPPEMLGGIIQPTKGGFVVVIIAEEYISKEFLSELDLHNATSLRQVEEKIGKLLREKKINVVGIGVREVEPL